MNKLLQKRLQTHVIQKLAYTDYGLEKKCSICGETEGKICIHHIDSDFTNNKKENLQILCNPCHIRHHHLGKKVPLDVRKKISEGNKIKVVSEVTKSRISQSKLGKPNVATMRKVIQFNVDGSEIKAFDSITEANKETNINIGNISQCCKGNRKTAGGFNWEFNI